MCWRVGIGTNWNQNSEWSVCKCLKTKWPGTESNRRRQPFQGCALPTELPGRGNFSVATASRLLQSLERLASSLFDVGVQAVTVSVHRHDRRETLDADVPHRFRNSELCPVDAQNLFYGPSIILRGPAYGVEINRATLLQ